LNSKITKNNFITKRLQEIEGICKNERCSSIKLSNDINYKESFNNSTNITLNSSLLTNVKYSKVSNKSVNEMLNVIRSNVHDLKSKLKIMENFIKKTKKRNSENSVTMRINQMNKENIKSEEFDNSKISFLVPRWIPDSIIKNCSSCSKSFGLFCRKHHCRKCGEIFCGKCCHKFDFFHPFYNSKVRICGECSKL